MHWLQQRVNHGFKVAKTIKMDSDLIPLHRCATTSEVGGETRNGLNFRRREQKMMAGFRWSPGFIAGKTGCPTRQKLHSWLTNPGLAPSLRGACPGFVHRGDLSPEVQTADVSWLRKSRTGTSKIQPVPASPAFRFGSAPGRTLDRMTTRLIEEARSGRRKSQAINLSSALGS